MLNRPLLAVLKIPLPTLNDGAGRERLFVRTMGAVQVLPSLGLQAGKFRDLTEFRPRALELMSFANVGETFGHVLELFFRQGRRRVLVPCPQTLSHQLVGFLQFAVVALRVDGRMPCMGSARSGLG